MTRASSVRPEIGLAAGKRRHFRWRRWTRGARRHRRGARRCWRSVRHDRRRRHIGSCSRGLLLKLRAQIAGELADDLRRRRLDHADAAAVLRHRARQHQVGMDENARADIGRLDAERRRGIGRAAAFVVAALRLHPRAVIGLVDILELHAAGKRQSHRTEPHGNLAAEILRIEHFGQRRARHARRDAPDVHQHRPGLRRRQRNVERIVEFHSTLTLILRVPAADHLRRADFLPNPARAGEQPVVVVALPDQLDADRQIVRPAMGRQRHARRVQRRPDRLHGAVAGRSEALGRFALHAWRQQHIEARRTPTASSARHSSTRRQPAT